MLKQSILGVTDARNQFSQLVERVSDGGDRVVIVKNSSPVAVILGAEEFDRMTALEEKRELYEDVSALIEALKADHGARYSLEDIRRELDID